MAMFSSEKDSALEGGRMSPSPVLNKLCIEEIDPELLENIRCPKCFKYYFSPIYLCPKGHNLCNYCKQEQTYNSSIFGKVENNVFGAANTFDGAFQFGGVKTSPSTSSSQSRIKNQTSGSSLAPALTNGIGNFFCGKCAEYFTVNLARRTAAKEKSIKILNFPCGNADKNCQYRNNLLQVEQHERTCIYAPRTCFYEGCDWKGTTEGIINHIKEKHTFIAMNEPQILTEGINIYPLLFDYKFFILKTSYSSCGTLKFSVLYPGEGNKYKFDIHLMGYNQDVGIRLTNYCETLMNENVKVSYLLSDDITVPFDCLKHFITDLQRIRFKISIINIY